MLRKKLLRACSHHCEPAAPPCRCFTYVAKLKRVDWPVAVLEVVVQRSLDLLTELVSALGVGHDFDNTALRFSTYSKLARTQPYVHTLVSSLYPVTYVTRGGHDAVGEQKQRQFHRLENALEQVDDLQCEHVLSHVIPHLCRGMSIFRRIRLRESIHKTCHKHTLKMQACQRVALSTCWSELRRCNSFSLWPAPLLVLLPPSPAWPLLLVRRTTSSSLWADGQQLHDTPTL